MEQVKRRIDPEQVLSLDKQQQMELKTIVEPPKRVILITAKDLAFYRGGD